MGVMEKNEIILEIGIGVAIVLISSVTLMLIKVAWGKIRLCYNNWCANNKRLKLLHKPIGYTPWTAKRRANDAWKEVEKKLQAERFPWLKTPAERKAN